MASSDKPRGRPGSKYGANASRTLKASEARRDRVRQKRRDDRTPWWDALRRESTLTSLAILLGVAVVLAAVVGLRPRTLDYRLGDVIRHDKTADVSFTYNDPERTLRRRAAARDATPRVYAPVRDVWDDLEQSLAALPDRVAGLGRDELPPALAEVLETPVLLKVQTYADEARRPEWESWVRRYVDALRRNPPVILPDAERAVDAERFIYVEGLGRLDGRATLGQGQQAQQTRLYLARAEQAFEPLLYPKIAALTQRQVGVTHRLDANATTLAQNNAAAAVTAAAGDVGYAPNQVLIPAGPVTARDLAKLAAEREAVRASMGTWAKVSERAGLAGVVLLLTGMLGVYVASYQPRVLHNHLRALGLSVLFAGTVFLAQLAALSTQPLYLFAAAPTLLVATIMAIAYDRRFALGVGLIHAAFVILAVSGDLPLLLTLAAGVVVTALLLDDVRSRTKLIEVGGAAGLAMAATAAAAGLATMGGVGNVVRDAGWAFGAGLGVGFLVLGVLPFVEKVFRITTSMTLLELSDVNHPLLLRLQREAPASYNHSLQVATLSEEAAREIGANCLLCRVAGYFHDVGKVHKADYFIENQTGGENRHLNLSPSVSLLIIVGHVKDGVELAREYGLPRAVIPFIQEHHGTTLVEFFYREAQGRQEQLPEGDREPVSEGQYRYPGPKPRSKETAIMMLADACESATRAMKEHNPSRIEDRVHDLMMKRLLDGQFDDCPLTLSELRRVEASLVRSLVNMYHGRIEYPDDKPQPDTQPDAARPGEVRDPTVAAAG